MLASSQKSAQAALRREAYKLLVTPADWLLSFAEASAIGKARPCDHPLILIVGPPRSGTTLVAQVMSYFLDVAYTSNVGSVFQRSPLLAHRRKNFWRSRSRPVFDSFYGQTERMSDTNDGFYLWNQWLGENRYEPDTQLSEQKIRQMQACLSAWTQSAGRPLLNKNNRNALAIRLLSKHLPNARFIIINRNPAMIAQSLVVARQKVQGDKSIGWGLQSRSTGDSEDPMAYVDAVCQQVTAIQNQIEDQRQSLLPHKHIEISYEDFCRNPSTAVENVAQKFDVKSLVSQRGPLNPFQISRSTQVTSGELARIQSNFPPETQTAEIA